jgi:hypothetical protein
MEINIDDNPNCDGVGQMIFNEIEPPKPIEAIMTTGSQGDIKCRIVGVESDGRFVQAYARKINDSGEGTCYLIYGGGWGIRMKPEAFAQESWNFKDPNQWGEAYKVYANVEDIFWRV